MSAALRPDPARRLCLRAGLALVGAGVGDGAMARPVSAALALPVAPATTPALRGFTENLAPLNFEQDGQVQGFSAELLRLIATEAGASLALEVLPWSRAVQQAAGHRHSVLFSLTRTPEREDKYQWVGPISPRRILFYRLQQRVDLKPAGPQPLAGLRVGVVRHSAAALKLEADGLRPELDLEYAQDDATNLRKLLAGRMDLLVMLDWAAAWHLKRQGLPLSTLQPVLPMDVDRAYWYGLPPDTDPALTRRLQDALERLRRDGRYERLRARYMS